MELLFGSFNKGKAMEIQKLLGDRWHLKLCPDFPTLSEVDETGTTLEANAALKAETYSQQTGLPCFADDTGLEVVALKGAPGVHSARYAGPENDAQANMEHLLNELKGHSDRSAQFRTVIAFCVPNQTTRFFEGALKGKILESKRGTGGFGYDPIFLPEGSERSLAEMTTEEKNRISHRARAFQLLLSELSQ